MTAHLAQQALMYFLVPLWLTAGFADWLCHRHADIEHTAGVKESLIHLLMFVEVGIPLLAAVFLEINALIIALMLAAFLLHEATALWDVTYAVSKRVVSPLEQHVHSFLEMIPMIAILLICLVHWDQFAMLLDWARGTASGAESLALQPKMQALPGAYIAVLFTAIACLAALPYANELWRAMKARRAGGLKHA